MLNIWTRSSGASLGTFEERKFLSINLPTLSLEGDLSAVDFSLISGRLPGGLRLQGNKIQGSPFEVAEITTSTFVIRARLGNEISDRTFTITIEGPDEPEWLTPEGDLKINPNGLAFVLDNSYIDFQLRAIDPDIRAGETLEFFIQDGDGELPPGLELTTDGKIVGFVDPILSLTVAAGTGYFDTSQYDTNPFDFGLAPKTGLDTFLFDTFSYDYSEPLRTPKKISRFYEFVVSVTDNVTIIKRRFRIFVVSDDFLRADNTILQIGNGAFTADATYLRGAIWLTAGNLGIRRADNFVTVFLDAFDPVPNIGPLVYELARENPDGTPSVLPEGLFLDANNGELFGFIPYQPAVTREFNFTVNAVKYDAGAFTESEIAVVVGSSAAYGQNFLEINPLPQADADRLVGEFLRIGNFQYKVIEYIPQTVVGGLYAIIRLEIPLKIDVPARDQAGNSTIFRKRFIESTIEFGTNISPKTFVLRVLGEVDSVIRFLTPSDLGKIKANFVSTLSVEAETSVPRAILNYKILPFNRDGTRSRLPPGLSLNLTGELIGKVNQFPRENLIGLTVFDSGETTFDSGDVTFDRQYRFTVLASDQFKYSAVEQEFVLEVELVTDRSYSNIYTQPYPSQQKRILFSNFINDTGIFPPEKIFRLNDPEFGVQTDLRMLVYAGIESSKIEDYVPALNRNIKRKRLKIGAPRLAVAKQQGSDKIIYEVIYLEIIDGMSKNNQSTQPRIKLPRNINSKVLINQARASAARGNLDSEENQRRLNVDEPDRFRALFSAITADNRNVFTSGQDLEYVYPSSITNIRRNLRTLNTLEDGVQRQLRTENEFLPLWMLTPQDARTAATGYVTAVPLCYCRAGQGQEILANILNSGFDFTQIDYEIDRFIIDATSETSEPQFLKFTNYKYNV
jgi:hypothetical protein